jgi:hypothetical protein
MKMCCILKQVMVVPCASAQVHKEHTHSPRVALARCRGLWIEAIQCGRAMALTATGRWWEQVPQATRIVVRKRRRVVTPGACASCRLRTQGNIWPV